MGDEELERLLQTAGTKWRRDAKCPTVDRLVAFRQRCCDPGEAAGIREHIAYCGLCDLTVSRIGNSERFAPIFGKGGSVKFPMVFLRNPIIACAGYVLALLLIAEPVWKRISNHDLRSVEVKPETMKALPPVALPDFSMISPRPIRLAHENIVRGRRKNKTGTSHVEGNDAAVLLSFPIPIKDGPGFHYDASIGNASGKVSGPIPLNGCDASGLCEIIMDARAFPPGKYNLTVREFKGKETPSGGVFRFDFER